MNTITGSGNIAVLDSGIIADLCVGKFFVNALPSVWIGGGAASIKGIKVKIVSPSRVAVKDYGTAYDIAAPATSTYEYPVPTQAGDYQYGDYKIHIQVTDSDNRTHEDIKIVPVCRVGRSGKTGVLGAKLAASCKTGKLYVSLNQLPLYQGLVSANSERTLTLYSPTSSGQENIESEVSSFTAELFEGVYKLDGEVCAEYSNEDNVSYRVKYIVDTEHDVKCVIDDCAVFYKLREIHERLDNVCTTKEREHATALTIDALRLYNTAKLGAECGEDVSQYISELEQLLGCRCTLGSDEGNRIGGTMTPSRDYVIEGCGITQSSNGLTTTYNIDNYEYLIEIVDNGGALVVSAPTISGCTKRQRLTFNIETVYGQIKARATSNAQEREWWGNMITVGGKPLSQLLNELNTKVDNCCDGGGNTACPASITEKSHVQNQANVTINWISANASAVDVYLDDVLKGTIPSSQTTYVLFGAANGQPHQYRLVPKCSDGRSGTPASGSFQFAYCPPIAAPTLMSSSIANVACPYNLNNAIQSIPAGTTHEWHTANNTDIATKVANPTAVTGGTYYAFAKDANGCYSPAAQLVLTCQQASVCSAPLGLTIGYVNNGFLVRFQSATTPPPNNSYTVMRRLTSAPDAPASWTIVGTPLFNASSQRWEVLDTTGENNISYTYRAISNCSESSKPYIDQEYTNLIGTVCGIVTSLNATMG